MKELLIRQPDDFHVHLRQGAESALFAADARDAGFARVLVMPNTLPPVIDGDSLEKYRGSLRSAAPELGLLMTFKVMPGMDRARLEELVRSGALAGKLYPEGVTTNSEDGFRRVEEAYEIFGLMEELGLVLCLHGEDPSAFSFDREKVFLKDFLAIRQQFPRLKMVLEHLSTAEAVKAVSAAGPLTAGTITAHHLMFTFDDMAGGKLNPHLFCKPLLKRPEDRQALVKAALSDSGRFFYGSDSAPHTRENKETCLCSAGCYTMPVGLPMLASVFEENGSLDKLENFTSVFGARFYGLSLNTRQIRLVREPFSVPELYHGVVPLFAGKSLPWSVKT